MKGADKAIVAKSFGKWKSSSLRSRTMEKPDEPSGESKEESLSKYTCADPQLGKKPVGKSASFLTPSPPALPCALAHFFPRFSVNYYCGDVCGLFLFLYFFFFFFVFLIWLSGPPYLVNKQTTLLGRRIPFEAKCVSDDTPLPGKDKAKNSKHKNSHRCMGKREKRVNGHCGPQEVFQC